MKKVLLGAAMAASMLLVAPAANAAKYLDIPAPGASGIITGNFGYTEIGAGDFEHIFEFNFPFAGATNGTISSTIAPGDVIGGLSDLKFNSITLNGHDFSILLDGEVEFARIKDILVASGPQKLTVTGWSGGDSSYAGVLTFAPTAAVPEPATWAMMIIGFGAAGSMVRSRRKLVPSVA